MAPSYSFYYYFIHYYVMRFCGHFGDQRTGAAEAYPIYMRGGGVPQIAVIKAFSAPQPAPCLVEGHSRNEREVDLGGRYLAARR